MHEGIDDGWEIIFLEQVDACRHIVGGIGWVDTAARLEESRATVVAVIDHMDGDAGHRLVVGHDSLVHVVAIHTLAAVVGQQSRMNIDNALGESIENMLRNQQQKASEDDIVDATQAQEIEHGIALAEVAPTEIVRLDAKVAGTGSDIGVANIIYNNIDHDIGASAEIFSNLLRIGAVARGHDGEFYRLRHTQIVIEEETIKN